MVRQNQGYHCFANWDEARQKAGVVTPTGTQGRGVPLVVHSILFPG